MSLDLQEHEGYVGIFTRSQAEGAHPNGSRVVKTRLEAGDRTPVGTEGTVLGSIGPQNEDTRAILQDRFGCSLGYFVEWDDRPKCAVFVMDTKIAIAS